MFYDETNTTKKSGLGESTYSLCCSAISREHIRGHELSSERQEQEPSSHKSNLPSTKSSHFYVLEWSEYPWPVKTFIRLPACEARLMWFIWSVSRCFLKSRWEKYSLRENLVASHGNLSSWNHLALFCFSVSEIVVSFKERAFISLNPAIWRAKRFPSATRSPQLEITSSPFFLVEVY